MKNSCYEYFDAFGLSRVDESVQSLSSTPLICVCVKTNRLSILEKSTYGGHFVCYTTLS